MSETVPERQHAVNARSAAADAFSALVVQVLQLAGALEAAGNTLTHPSGQSTARWQVLAAVEEAPRPVADVARALSLTRQSIQRVADLLVLDGLARYADNPAHQRAKLLLLTDRGLAVLRGIQAAQSSWAERIGDGLEPTELDAARRTLAEVLQRLRE